MAARDPKEQIPASELPALRAAVAADARTVYAAVADIKSKLPADVSRWALKDPGGPKALLDQQDLAFANWIQLVGEFSGSGTISGKPPTWGQLSGIYRLGSGILTGYAEIRKLLAETTVGAIAWASLVQSLEQAVTLAAKFADSAARILSGFASTAGAVGDLLGWLPWIAGVLILGPPILRTITSKDRAGTAAAELDRGRAAAGRAAGSAFRAGARVASGGALGAGPRDHTGRFLKAR